MSRKPITIVLLTLVAAVALLVPTTMAQPAPTLASPTLSPTDLGVIQPLVTKSFSVNSEYEFNQPASQLGGLEGAVTITTAIRCPTGVTVDGQETVVIVIDPSQSDPSYPVKADFQLTISRTVPAFETQQCTITMSGSAVGTGIPAPETQTRGFSVQADYFGLIEAKTDVKLKQGAPQKQVPFNIDVTNFGNGQTKVTFTTEDKPGGKWQGLPPDQLLLDEAGGNKERDSVIYTVVTPFKNGWNNEEGGFTIRIHPEYAFNADKTGSDIVVNLVARVRGVYVPTLEPMLMLGAVIGTGMMARLLKED